MLYSAILIRITPWNHLDILGLEYSTVLYAALFSFFLFPPTQLHFLHLLLC
jgi:hypothetical protein